MAAAGTSLMGSKKATSMHMVAIGLVLGVLMGLSLVQEAEAQTTPVINSSGAAVNVTVSVNGTIVASVVVQAGASVNLTLPLNVPLTFTFTNLLTQATRTVIATLHATAALLITPTLIPLLNTVNVLLVDLLGGVFNLLRILLLSL